jgi:integrase
MSEIRGQTLMFKGKKDKLHAAPLHKRCLPLVERRRTEGAALLVDLPAMPSKAWHSFFKRLGLGHLSFHSTRVTVVSRLIRANVSPAVVMQYVGHASQTVNEIYRRHRPLDVAHLGALL